MVYTGRLVGRGVLVGTGVLAALVAVTAGPAGEEWDAGRTTREEVASVQTSPIPK